MVVNLKVRYYRCHFRCHSRRSCIVRIRRYSAPRRLFNWTLWYCRLCQQWVRGGHRLRHFRATNTHQRTLALILRARRLLGLPLR